MSFENDIRIELLLYCCNDMVGTTTSVGLQSNDGLTAISTYTVLFV